MNVRISQLSIVVLVLIAITGCGGGHSITPQPTPTPTASALPFFSGLYVVSGASNISSSTDFNIAGSLMQSGNTVAGVMHFSSSPCFSGTTDIPVNGPLGVDSSGNFTIVLAFTLPSGQTLSMNLIHPGGHLSLMAGTYSISGAGCAGADQGNISASFMDISGTLWAGTLTSSGGTASQVHSTLTQTGPNAHGFFSATGTASITGGTCFSSGTVGPTSIVIGAGSQLVLDNSQAGSTGTTVLQGTFAPLPFGGATFTGTYTSTQGACSESGTASMSFS